MRIALVTHQFFPNFYTGVERISLNLAKQFARMGHEAIVVTSARHSSGSAERYVVEGVPVHPIAVGPTDLTRPWTQSSAVEASIARILTTSEINVVDVMHPLRLPMVFRAAASRGIPLIAHAADFYYTCARIQMRREDGAVCNTSARGLNCQSVCGLASGPDRFAWCREILDSAAAVVAPSRSLIDLHRHEGFAVDHWHHVVWGTDYALYRSPPVAARSDELVVGFVGTLLPHKGPHLSVEALRLLPHADVRLELFGGSFGERRYERDLRALSAGDPRIRFRGSYAHSELGRIFAELDVVVVPSLWHENMPTVALNAAAARVPVIGADAAGIRELIADYRSGFLFSPGSAADLARVLEEIVRDRSLLDATRRRTLDPPSLEEEAFRLESLYLAATAEAGYGADL